jgi:hypothetical protein
MEMQDKGRVQDKGQVVIVDDWQRAADYDGTFPIGSREKKALFCPADAPYPFLIPKHKYLFKESVHRHPHQFWMEIVGYKIGLEMKVPVPPAFVSQNSGTPGALIEFFFGYPDVPSQGATSGEFYMVDIIPNYDIKKGEQHNFKSICEIFASFEKEGSMDNNWINDWAKFFTFDAIIGNTDRHQANWEVIRDIPSSDTDASKARLSPAFDNGTSLGHEILDEKIKYKNIDTYILKGKHHIKWDLSGEKLSHFDFLAKYIQSYPDSRQTIEDCITFDIKSLSETLYSLCDFDMPVKLTANRVEFMLKLTTKRREKIECLLRK